MAINYTYPVKGSPVTTDEFLIVDSSDNSTKKVTVANILALGQGGDVGVASLTAVSPISNIGTATDVNLTLTTVPVAKGGTNLTALGSALNVLQVNSAGTALEYASTVEGAKHVIQDVRFVEAVVKGDPVYITGYSPGNGTTVAKADASDPAKMPAYGVANETVSQNTNGTVTAIGSFNGTFDTSSLIPNKVIYVAVGGGLTSTKPAGEANLIQNIGFCSRSNVSTGEIEVVAVGRTNATPNLDSAKIFLGNSSNQSVATAVTGEVTISNTGVTEVTGIDGNVSIQGYSPVVISAETTAEISTENLGKTLVLSAGTTDFSITDSAEFAVGTEINLINSAGQIIVAAPSGGGTLNGAASDVSITAAYGQAILKKIASNTYVIYGDIV